MNVFDYFFDQSKSLEKNFILGPKEQASYEDIYNTSLKLASYLNRKIGINKNVLIVSENSFFFIVAYLSVLKSGNVCIPINPGLEEKLRNQIINESKPELAFVSKRYKRTFTEYQHDIIDNSDIPTVISEIDFDEGYQSGNFDDNTLAEIIYTSGSTGEQKGVMISHKNIIANTDSILQYLRLSNNDIIEVVMPFTIVMVFHYFIHI